VRRGEPGQAPVAEVASRTRRARVVRASQQEGQAVIAVAGLPAPVVGLIRIRRLLIFFPCFENPTRSGFAQNNERE